MCREINRADSAEILSLSAIRQIDRFVYYTVSRKCVRLDLVAKRIHAGTAVSPRTREKKVVLSKDREAQ